MTNSNSSDAGPGRAQTNLGKSFEAAKGAAHELSEAARDVGATGADAISREAGRRVVDFGGALQLVAAKLAEARSEISEPVISGLVGEAEGRIRSTAQAVGRMDARKTVASALSFARDNPALTIGAAMAVGYGLARAGKVAAREMSSRQTVGGYVTNTGGHEDGEAVMGMRDS